MAENTAVYLKWNLPNWITITLMAVVGFMLFGFIASAIGQLTGDAGSSDNAGQ